MSIFYTHDSFTQYKSIRFDRESIRCENAIDLIMTQEEIDRTHFTIVLKNAETHEEYLINQRISDGSSLHVHILASNNSKDQQKSKRPPPAHLLCTLCNDQFEDAVQMVCCGFTCCEYCVEAHLLKSRNARCPGYRCYQPLRPSSFTINGSIRLCSEVWTLSFKVRNSRMGCYAATIVQSPKTETPYISQLDEEATHRLIDEIINSAKLPTTCQRPENRQSLTSASRSSLVSHDYHRQPTNVGRSNGPRQIPHPMYNAPRRPNNNYGNQQRQSFRYSQTVGNWFGTNRQNFETPIRPMPMRLVETTSRRQMNNRTENNLAMRAAREFRRAQGFHYNKRRGKQDGGSSHNLSTGSQSQKKEKNNKKDKVEKEDGEISDDE